MSSRVEPARRGGSGRLVLFWSILLVAVGVGASLAIVQGLRRARETALIDRLLDAESDIERRKIAETSGSTLVKALVRGLHDSSDGVVAECCRGLQYAASAGGAAREAFLCLARGPLLAIARDPGRADALRARAVEALGFSGDRSLLGPLRELEPLAGPHLSAALVDAIERLEDDFD